MARGLRTVVLVMLQNPSPSAVALRPSFAPGADTVMSALRGAADETGADFGYLLNTAMRESSLNPAARASTSSATGLFQFIEQTWLGTMRAHGVEHGFQAYADAIQPGKDGRFTVTEKGLRQEILALRNDPKAASLMAGELTNDMRGNMEAALGRGVSAGELYVAHFLGPQAAVKMVKAAAETPAAAAATFFPDAASANRRIFYDKSGGARTVSAVLDALKAKHEGQPASSTTLLAQVQTEPPAQLLRSTISETAGPSSPSGENMITRFGMNTMVMSPIMAQLLSEIDLLPSLADAFRPDDQDLLRTRRL